MQERAGPTIVTPRAESGCAPDLLSQEDKGNSFQVLRTASLDKNQIPTTQISLKHLGSL